MSRTPGPPRRALPSRALRPAEGDRGGRVRDGSEADGVSSALTLTTVEAPRGRGETTRTPPTPSRALALQAPASREDYIFDVDQTELDDPRSVVAVSEAAQLLAEARTLDDVRHVHDLAEAARLYARKAHLGLAAQNHAAAISLEAQTKADEIIRAAREAGELATQGQGLPKQSTPSTVSLPTLADIDVSRDEAANWARVRAVPAEQRAEYVTHASAAGEEVTRVGLLRYAERRRVPDPRADEVPPVPDDADLYVHPRDLWLLGDHRLLCGDATDPADVARLLDGAEPTLLATDPPYGVSLDPTWRDNVYNTAGRLGAKAYPAERPYMLRDGTAGQPDARHGTRANRVAPTGAPAVIATPG